MKELSKNDKYIAFVIFIILAIYYGVNCPPRVTVEDSGDFIMGLSSLGIVHGPSFPLYTMLGFLFSKIPIGELGFRLAFFSALLGAAGSSLFYIFQRYWGLTAKASLVSSLAVAVTNVYMSQSIIVEVYSLNVVLILLLFIFTLKANEERSGKWIFLMGLATGSGLIHHYPLFLTSCIGLVFIFDWSTLNKKTIPMALAGFLIGLLPFLYLIIQSQNPNLDYNFGKVASWEMLWKQFLRQGYKGVDEAGGTFYDKLLLSWAVIKLYAKDFTFLSILIPLGLLSIKKNLKSLGLLISLISSSFLIIFLLGFSFKPHYVAVIKAYLLPHFIFLGIFIAYGFDYIEKKKELFFYPAIILILLNAVLHFKDTSHFNDNFVYLWAKKGLESLERNSVLILCGQEPYALYYANKFKEIRPDVTIYDRLSIMTEENLYSPELLFWKVKTKKQFNSFRENTEKKFFKNSTRPIYLTCADKFANHGYKIKPTVYFNRVLNHVPFKATPESQVIDESLLKSAVNNYPKNEYWLDSIRNMVLFNTFSFYLDSNKKEIPNYLSHLKNHKNSSDQDFMHSLLEHTYKKDLKQYLSLYDWNLNLNGESKLQPGTLGRYCTALATQKKYEEAYSYCIKALKISKPCNVSLLNNLLFISFNMKKYGFSKEWANSIIECKPNHKGAKAFLRSIK